MYDRYYIDLMPSYIFTSSYHHIILFYVFTVYSAMLPYILLYCIMLYAILLYDITS